MRTKTDCVRPGYQRDRYGFTLVELLVVIAIISILAGLLLPALESAIDAARRVSCALQMQQMGMGLELYVDDYGDCYPFKRAYWHEGKADNGGRWQGDDYIQTFRSIFSRGYVSDPYVALCPSQNVHNDPYDLIKLSADGTQVTSEFGYTGTYVYSGGGLDPALYGSHSNWHYLFPMKRDRIRAASRFVMLYDWVVWVPGGPTGGTNNHNPDYDVRGGNIMFADNSVSWANADEWTFGTSRTALPLDYTFIMVNTIANPDESVVNWK